MTIDEINELEEYKETKPKHKMLYFEEDAPKKPSVLGLAFVLLLGFGIIVLIFGLCCKIN